MKSKHLLLRSAQPFSTLKIFLVSKDTKIIIHATLCLRFWVGTLESASSCVGSVRVGRSYSGCSFSSMSDTRMFFSACSAMLELVRLYRAPS